MKLTVQLNMPLNCSAHYQATAAAYITKETFNRHRCHTHNVHRRKVMYAGVATDLLFAQHILWQLVWVCLCVSSMCVTVVIHLDPRLVPACACNCLQLRYPLIL